MEMDQATVLYNAKVLAPDADKDLGPESPQLQRLELQPRLASLVQQFGDKLSPEERSSLGGISEVLEKINEREMQPWKKRKAGGAGGGQSRGVTASLVAQRR